MTQGGSVSIILLCFPASFPTQSLVNTLTIPVVIIMVEADREPALMETILTRSEDPGVAVIKKLKVSAHK